MSASLVGSEMCIRDRPTGHCSAKGPGGFSFGVCAWEVRLTSPLAQHPVSYTHLTLPTICSV
eukprot:3834772-Alexandrium_andersonii.AAC.1